MVTVKRWKNDNIAIGCLVTDGEVVLHLLEFHQGYYMIEHT